MIRARTRTRAALRLAAVWTPTVVLLGSWPLLEPPLPASLATRWSGSTAEGWAPTALVFGVAAVISVTTAACAGRGERRRVWIASGFSAFSATVWIVVAVVNLQSLPELGGWGLVTPFAFLYGALPAWLTVAKPGADTGDEAGMRPVAAEAARDVVFSPVLCILAACTGVESLFVAEASAGEEASNWMAIGLGLTTVVAAEFAVVRITLSPRGLVVFGTIPGLPLYSIRADRIRSVEALHVRPLDWGGWGYRIGGRGTGVIVRSGPGVTIHSTSGGAFTVSVRHPERFVSPAAGA